MIIYFILLFVVVSAIYVGQHSEGKITLRWMYAIACSSMVFVAGARSRYVGTDAGYYADMFKDTLTSNDVVNTPLEPGYFILSWLVHALSDNYIIIFSVVVLITTICFTWVIYRYSVDQTISVFVLLVGGFYFIAFNGFRQGLANAIFFLAIGALFRRNFLHYAICVAVAILFHKSVIIALPAYFLITRKNDLQLNLLIIILGIFSVNFFGLIIDLGGAVDQRYVQYGEASESGLGLTSMAFTLVLCAFFMFFKSRIISGRSMYDMLLNMFLLATTITIVSAVHSTGASGIRRLAMYFSMSAILIWPIIYKNITQKREKMLFTYCFTVFYLLYFGLTLQYFGNMVPYTFNPLVIEWLSSII